MSPQSPAPLPATVIAVIAWVAVAFVWNALASRYMPPGNTVSETVAHFCAGSWFAIFLLAAVLGHWSSSQRHDPALLVVVIAGFLAGAWLWPLR